MKKLLLLPLLFGLASPAIAHNDFNGGCGNHCVAELGWKSNPGVKSNSINKQNRIINDEKNQTSSIDNQEVDTNFIVKSKADTKNSMATYILIGILAIFIPLVSWWYFTK